MRKILSVVLLVIMMISVVACGNEQTGSVEKAEKYCLWCGANNLETAAFCGSCGTSFGDTSALSTPEIQATATPTSRATSAPISTPRPTSTPKPTATPKPAATPVAVTELDVFYKEHEMCVGETKALADRITIRPSYATNKTLTWKSSNTSVATVDNNGNVTAKAGGSVKITATSSNGISTSFDVSVYNVKLPSTPLQLTENGYFTGTVKVKITKISNPFIDAGRVMVTIEGEIISAEWDSLYFDVIVTDPDGYIYKEDVILSSLPQTSGAKFKQKVTLFAAHSFGSDELTPGNYTVVFENTDK